mgnify:CR=1 FL=1
MFDTPEFYADASPLGKAVLILIVIAGAAQLVVAAVLALRIALRRRQHPASDARTKRERVEAMARAEDEAAKQERLRNAPAVVRALHRLLAHLTPRGLWRDTRYPSTVGLVLDVAGLVGFGAAVVLALQHVGHWREAVPVTRSTITEYEAIDLRAVDNRPPFYTQQLFEVTDLDGRCCDTDTMARLPQSALPGGYKLVVLGHQQMWPERDLGDLPRRVECEGRWEAAGRWSRRLARVMATVEHLQAPFDLQVWYVNMTRPLRQGDLYLAPPFREACAQAGGCFSRYLLPGKASLELQEQLVYEGRLSGSDRRSPGAFMAAVNGGGPRDGSGAYIIDDKGRIRAEIDPLSGLSTLHVIEAVFAVARADGRALPQRLRSHFRVGDTGPHTARATPYFEQRLEHDAGVAPVPRYAAWLDRFDERGLAYLVPGTGTLGDWSRLAPWGGGALGVAVGTPSQSSADARKTGEDGDDV